MVYLLCIISYKKKLKKNVGYNHIIIMISMFEYVETRTFST